MQADNWELDNISPGHLHEHVAHPHAKLMQKSETETKYEAVD